MRIFALTTAAAVLFATCAPAVAKVTAGEGCKIFADDQAEIMGVRQRGEPVGNTLDRYNWRFYDSIGLWPVMRELTGLAWQQAVPSSAAGRQRQVRDWAETAYAVCMK